MRVSAGFGWSVLVGLVLSMGCASTPTAGDGPVQQEEELDTTKLPSGIWSVQSGEPVELEEFLNVLSGASFVLVGESHGDEFHHKVQQEIYAGLTLQRPGQVMLGMEMVEHQFQQAIDAYLEGEIHESEMLSRVEWDERWGVSERNYAPMWRLAKEEGQRVVGLNARRELVREVAQVGMEGLSEAKEQELPEMDLSNEDYRRQLRQVYESHDMGDVEDGLERFVQAQIVWDESMAETAYGAIAGAEQSQMVILTGRGHMERGYGIPSRLIRRGAAAEDVITVLPVTIRGGRAAPMSKYRDLQFLRAEEISDYVWIQDER